MFKKIIIVLSLFTMACGLQISTASAKNGYPAKASSSEKHAASNTFDCGGKEVHTGFWKKACD